MADATTWINVADNAVKIGLGALLGGAFGVLVAWLNNKSQVKKALLERRRMIIEGVLEAVDSSTNAASVFWANLSNAVFKRDSDQKITEADRTELKALETKFFAAFTALNSCSAKLLLLGESESDSKLTALRAAFDAFFKIANLENKNCTKEALDKHKSALSSARKEFYQRLSKAYQHDA